MAQEPEPKLPSTDQVRQYYQNASANWHATPLMVLQAFAGAEDRYFYERPVGRSTITIQLGSWFLRPGAGRLQQISFAQIIGEELSHEEVLHWYVNQVFFGRRCFGVSDAAGTYFGVAVHDISLEQAAYLAALPKAPALFNPLKSYDRAVERRNFVLREMQKTGFVSANEAQRAANSELVVIEPLGRCEKDQ